MLSSNLTPQVSTHSPRRGVLGSGPGPRLDEGVSNEQDDTPPPFPVRRPGHRGTRRRGGSVRPTRVRPRPGFPVRRHPGQARPERLLFQRASPSRHADARRPRRLLRSSTASTAWTPPGTTSPGYPKVPDDARPGYRAEAAGVRERRHDHRHRRSQRFRGGRRRGAPAGTSGRRGDRHSRPRPSWARLVVRILARPQGALTGGTFERTLEWMVPDIEACVDHGRQHGVIVGLQNHQRLRRRPPAETITDRPGR